MISIFDYADHRLFLKDAFTAQRKQERSLKRRFSHRAFAKLAGLTSPGLICDVMVGRRRLTQDLVMNVAQAFKLKKDETEYLDRLVQFKHAKTTESRIYCFEQLLRIKKVKPDVVGRDLYEYYRQWYYAAIRGLLFFFPFKNKYNELAKKLTPSIRPHQAKRAIKILTRLGLVKRDEKGFFRPALADTTSSPAFTSLHDSSFNTAMGGLAIQSVDRHRPEHRDISTLTLALSQKSVTQITREIELLRERFMKIALDEQQADRVCQLNFQLFPLSVIDDNAVSVKRGEKGFL